MRSRLPATLATVVLCWLAALPAAAQSRLEKSFTLAPGGQFRLETDLGSVRVTGREGTEVRVVVTSRRELDELLRFSFKEGPGELSVTARRIRRDWLGRGSRASVRYEIEVPRRTRVDVSTSGGGIEVSALDSGTTLRTSGGGIEARDIEGDLVADTSGGGIRIRNLHGRARVETSGGGIEAEAVEGSIEAETSSGPIVLEGVSGNIRAHTSGGGIRIENAGGRVEADTSGGGIEASFARGNARGGSLESSGGGIVVAIDPAVNLEIVASGNSVKTDVSLRVRGETSRGRLSGTLGKGGETLRLQTSGGSVRISSL